MLNAGYANGATSGQDAGLRFVLADVEYVSNTDYYTNCLTQTPAITHAHTYRADTHLNVFTCSGEGLLG